MRVTEFLLPSKTDSGNTDGVIDPGVEGAVDGAVADVGEVIENAAVEYEDDREFKGKYPTEEFNVSS